MITLEQITDHVTHVLGGSIPDAVALGAAAGPAQAAHVANLAGRHLFAAHTWSFRNRGPSTISFVASQNTYALPADFGEAHTTVYNNTLSDRFQFTTFDTFARLRNLTIPSQFAFFGVITQPAQTSASANLGPPNLIVHPTPEANLTDALEFWYRALWADLSAATDRPALPDWIEMAYIELVREVALGMVRNDLAPRIQQFLAGDLLNSLKQLDGLQQPTTGQITGGLLEGRFLTVSETVSNISGPVGP